MTVSELMSKYTSCDKIKKGGQKTVFRAINGDGSIVALKLIHNADDPRVLQEIDLLKTLDIDCIPKILESGTVTDETVNENVLYIVEEFIEGQSLRDWLKNGNKADLPFAVDLLDSLLSIEMELEKKSILHRDINPNNVIIGKNGQVYLIDFGLAKIIGGHSLTKTAATMGPFTPGYAPHEQFANMKLLQDVRTDLFQIGVTVYECCTGSNPFVKPGGSIYEIMSNTIMMVPPLVVLKGDNQGKFARLINMLMSKNQSQRPDSASDAYRYLAVIKTTLN